MTLTCSQVYIDDSYPYEYGPLDVNVTYFSRALPEADGDNPEMHSTSEFNKIQIIFQYIIILENDLTSLGFYPKN